MKKVLLFLSACLCTYLSSFSQSTLSGTVKGNDGTLLTGATVAIEKSYLGTVTDLNGHFSFQRLKNKTYQLKISYLGYKTQLESVDLKGDKRLDIVLKPQDIITDEVVVSATRASAKDPFSFSEVDKEAIRQQNTGKDMPYILNLTPSLVTTSDAGTGVGSTTFRVRGSDLSRINVTINGVPLNESESQEVWWVDLPDFASSVDNIQIQRGVGTSTNGAGAFGATLNFKTSALNKDAYAELNSTAGSFNTFKNTINVGTGLMHDKFAFDARLSQITSDGYVKNSGTNLKSFALIGGYYGKKTIVKASIFGGQEKTHLAWDGIPADKLSTDRRYNGLGLYTGENGQEQYYDNETDNYTQTHYQLFFSRELAPSFNFNATMHYTHGEGYYEEYKPGESYADYALPDVILGNDTVTSSDMITRKWLKNDFYGLTYTLSYAKKRINALLGGSWDEYDGSHYGNLVWERTPGNIVPDYRWYDHDGVKKDFNMYAKINFLLTEKLHIYADAQYRHVYYSIKGHDREIGLDGNLRDVTQLHLFDFFNPKAGLSYDINANQNLYFSFATAHREPTHDNYVDADPAKDKPMHETLNDYELGYKLNFNSFTACANLFYMDYRNQLVLTGKINDVGGAVMTNVHKSYRQGVELSAGATIANILHWDGNISFSRSEIVNYEGYIDNWDNGGQMNESKKHSDLAFSPDIVAANQFCLDMPHHVKVYLMSKYVGKQYVDNSSSNDRKLNPYLLNDFKVNYDFKLGLLKQSGIFFMVNNIFNVKYISNAWVYRYVYEGKEQADYGYFPQAGIHFTAGLSLRF